MFENDFDGCYSSLKENHTRRTTIRNSTEQDEVGVIRWDVGDVMGILLTPWLMEPGGSMPHSQGLSNNSYPESNQPNSPH